jgi:photosystem II stability/assembly factor-like uncharacterized protein
LFKSTDACKTWAAVNPGLAAWPISSLAIDPSTPSTLYAGTNLGAVFKSTDGSATWAAVYSGPTPSGFDPSVFLAINPSTPSTVYLGASRVFKSADGGATWVASSNMARDRFGVSHVSALVIDPSNPSTLYAGTDIGVFKSIDDGRTWVATNLESNTWELTIDTSSPSTLYGTSDAGLFKSTDGGGTWAAVNLGLKLTTETTYQQTKGRKKPETGLSMRISSLVIDHSNPSSLYAGTNLGGEVFKSTDGGKTWTALAALHAELLRAFVPVVKVRIK